MAPPLPIPNTGFLNFIQQSIQGAGFGSIRKPFAITYSSKKSSLVSQFPFGNLGDRPIPPIQRALDLALSTELLPDAPEILLNQEIHHPVVKLL